MKLQPKTLQRLSHISETVLLALLGCYLLVLESLATTFHFSYPDGIQRYLFLLIAGVVVLRIPLIGFRKKELWCALAAAAVCFLSYRATGYIVLLFCAVLMVGLVGVDYRKVLRTFVFTIGGFLLLTVLAALSGGIENLVYADEGLRSSWGMLYPTNLASAVLFVFLVAWVAWENLPDWVMLLLALLPLALALFVARSRTSTICGLLFLVMILYHMFDRRILSERPGLRRFRSVWNGLLPLVFPLCAVIMFGLMLAYSRGADFAVRINELLTNRIAFAVDAWNEYGVTLFGTPFEMVGYGGSTFRPAGYNYVDSSYPLLLLRYGIAMFLLFGFGWIWMTLRAVRKDKIRLALVLALIALHSFSEHHFVDPAFHPFLLLPFAAYPAAPEPSVSLSAPQKQQRRKAVLIRCGYVAVAGTALYLLLPWLVSELKTFLTCSAISFGENKFLLAGFFALLLILLALLLFGGERLLEALLLHRRVRRAGLIAASVSLVGFSGILACAAIRIQQAAPAWLQTHSVEVSVLREVVSVADGKVYAAEAPMIYRKELPALAYTPLSGGDYARLSKSTVLLSAKPEENVFFRKGFLYAQISDRYAIYTADSAVAAKLRTLGYAVTGYYNTEQKGDLAEAAARCQLPYEAENGVLLEPEHMLSLPIDGLFSGAYTAWIELTHPVTETGGAVCTLSITAENGAVVLAEDSFCADAFDAKETAEIALPFTVPEWARSYSDLAVTVKSESTLTVQSVRYARTPAYDIHAVYDRKLRPTREEYWSLDGEPVLNDAAFFAVTYAYDNAGNILCYRYFGLDRLPVLIQAGYAELRCTYLGSGKLASQSYYDESGNPVVLNGGYSEILYEYTADGELSLLTYTDANGTPLEMGSSYLHRYLRSLLDKDVTIFLSVKDEASRSLTATLAEDLAALGLKTDLRGKYRSSFCAVIRPDSADEVLSDAEPVTLSGNLDNVSYTVSSAGYLLGSYSSIVLNGTEYAKNARGLNLVVWDNRNGVVLDTVGFDTHMPEMTVTR